MTVYVGTCAWADHHGFYPKSLKPSDRLAFYAQYFSLVEVDSTYYGIPSPSSVAQWDRQTPAEFVFDVKAYRALTKHDRGEASEAELERDFLAFEAAVSVLQVSGKLGHLLFQFPPWYVVNEENRDYIETIMARFQSYNVGIEFRHRSWWQDDHANETLTWLRELGAINVVCDEPQSGMGTIPFVPMVTNRSMVVFRLHGRNADTWYQKGLTSSQQRFDYKYDVSELAEFLPSVQAWAQQATDVHILMNNNQGDYAIANAFDWLSILGAQSKPRPKYEQTEQLSLFDFT